LIDTLHELFWHHRLDVTLARQRRADDGAADRLEERSGLAIEQIGQPAKLLRREIAPATLDVSNLSCSYAKPCCDLHLRETPRRANVGNALAEPAVVAQPCRATACRPAVAGAQILAKHDRYSSLVA